MAKIIFCYLLLLHLLGEYYIPSFKKTEKNEKNFKDLFILNLGYLIVFCIGSVFIWSIQIFLIFLALSFAHFIIQLILFLSAKRHKTDDEAHKFILFVTSQALSIIAFGILTIIFTDYSINFNLQPWARFLLGFFSLHGREILNWLCIFLIIHKPTNIVIKQLLKNYKPAQDKKEISNNAGAFIGTLERIIIALLLSVNQYSAIGLVLTAKSIARYEKITKEKDFSEYYLLGTLLSTLVVIGTIIFFK
jgi:hypothetical protein